MLTPTLTTIPLTRTPTRPPRGLLQGCPYTPAARTDVTETWRKYGWRPASEQGIDPLEQLNKLTIYKRDE